MAGLGSELNIPPLIVARAIGRDKQTVVHACRIIQAIREDLDGDNIVEILGEESVAEFLGGYDGAELFLEHAGTLIGDLFAAFKLVAIRGVAYDAALGSLQSELGANL